MAEAKKRGKAEKKQEKAAGKPAEQKAGKFGRSQHKEPRLRASGAGLPVFLLGRFAPIFQARRLLIP